LLATPQGPLLAASAVAAEEAREPPFYAAVRYQTPYHWAGAYALAALLLLALAAFKKDSPQRHKGHKENTEENAPEVRREPDAAPT
jgi:hypothetical protein